MDYATSLLCRDMKTYDILALDYRENESREIIQKVLKKIKPLSKCISNVPLEKIERCAKVICEKYNYWLRFYSDTASGDDCIVWRCEVFDSNDLQLIKKIYGCTFYECMSKVVIYLYSIIKRRS